MFSRINLFADPQRAGASAGAGTSTPTSRQTPAPSNEHLEPLLNRRPEQIRADARMAVRDNNASKLQALLRESPQLLTQPFGDKGDTLLTEAARTGKSDAVQAILMQAKYSDDKTPFSVVVNQGNADGGTALTLAVEHGKLDVAKMLVKHDEVVEGNTEVAMAIRQNHPDLAKSLVKHGPANIRVTSTSTALADARAAAHLGDVNKLQALLRQNPALLTMQFGKKKETLLTEAARVGNTGSVQAILAHAKLNLSVRFADFINRSNADGDTALAQAIQHGSLDVAISLLAYKETEVTLANQRGQTPLHHAAKAENPAFAVRLLGHEKIQVGQADIDGNTPLHVAIDWGRSETAVKIANHPTAAPDKVNHSGQSALTMAINSKNLRVIDRLLKHPEVNPDRTDSRGRTLLWQSLDSWENNMSLGEPDMPLPEWSQILGMLAASPKVESNRLSAEGETPLTFLCKLSCPWHIAAHVEFDRWRNRTVQAMLEGGRRGQGQLDPNAKNAAKETPYEVALAATNTALAQVFEADAEARRARGPAGPQPGPATTSSRAVP